VDGARGLASYSSTSASTGPPARERPSSFSFCTGTAAVVVAVRSGAARRARVPAAGIGTRVPAAKAAEAEAMHAAILRARGGVAAAAAREGRGGAGAVGGERDGSAEE